MVNNSHWEIWSTGKIVPGITTELVIEKLRQLLPNASEEQIYRITNNTPFLIAKTDSAKKAESALQHFRGAGVIVRIEAPGEEAFAISTHHKPTPKKPNSSAPKYGHRWKLMAAVVPVLIIAYVVAGPWITMYRIKYAVNNGDTIALAQYIDFALIRESCKSQISVAITKNFTEDGDLKNNMFAGLALVFIPKIVDVTVNTYLTPSGIVAMTKGETPQMGHNKKVGAEESKPSTGENQTQSVRRPFDGARTEFNSANTFSAWIDGKNGDPLRLVFSRSGLSWRMTDIILPIDSLN